MKLFQNILFCLKEVILSFTPNRSLCESMMKFDFKIDDSKQNVMQLCFSTLANGPLVLILGLIWIDPTQSLWSLDALMQKIFGEDSTIRFFLLDGHGSTMLIMVIIFFVLEWILRNEYLLLALIFYFLRKSELHLHLALASLIGVYFSRACYLWWFHIELKSQTKHIWKRAMSLQWIATSLVSILGLYMLDYYQRYHFFSQSISSNRYEFLFQIFLIFNIAIFIFLSLWGHFYFKKIKEPSFLPIYFSTTTWILRFKMSFLLKKKLKEKVTTELKSHTESLTQIQELKDQGLGQQVLNLEETLNQELLYLETAASRLTID